MRGRALGSFAAAHRPVVHALLEKVNMYEDSSALLVLYSYNCHPCNMELIQIAQQNSIKIVSLHTHSTHKLQTHDKKVHGPSDDTLQ
jgi:hypothetical protein